MLHLAESSNSKVYGVYMGNKMHSNPEMMQLKNHELLALVHNGSLEKTNLSMVYSYQNQFRGFAAQLTDEQAAAMANTHVGVVLVFSNKLRKLHTTYSWKFLGM